MKTYKIYVNGKSKNIKTHSMKRLLDVLREEFGLTGSKEGCGEGECGACSIMMEGKVVNSCLVPAAQANRKKIQTIEGITNKVLQECFIKNNAAQCGICTPGMMVSAHAFLLEKKKEKKKFNLEDVQIALSGNLCRCTGYMKIFDAVLEAGKILKII